MNLIKLRLRRQPTDAVVDCDSTTRSAWGNCLADIHWGRNKDNEKLQNTLEVTIYSLTTHEPVYYRSFAGNTSDISTIRTILSDINSLNIKNIKFIMDRGYVSDENIALFVALEIPFIMCYKVKIKKISSLLNNIQYNSDGIPLNMNYDDESKLFYTQIDIPSYAEKLPDGSEIEIIGLKANLYLNLPKRTEELTNIHLKILEEEKILIDKTENDFIPDDLKKI